MVIATWQWVISAVPHRLPAIPRPARVPLQHRTSRPPPRCRSATLPALFPPPSPVAFPRSIPVDAPQYAPRMLPTPKPHSEPVFGHGLRPGLPETVETVTSWLV